LCFIYFNNLVKHVSGARLWRCLICSKTVAISLAKFHEIQKTNNAHYVTMTSNTYRFCWKQALTSKIWCRLYYKTHQIIIKYFLRYWFIKYGAIYGTYCPEFFLRHWRWTACTEFFCWFQCTQTVFKINTIIYRNISYF
jgi:hypothetical protein